MKKVRFREWWPSVVLFTVMIAHFLSSGLCQWPGERFNQVLVVVLPLIGAVVVLAYINKTLKAYGRGNLLLRVVQSLKNRLRPKGSVAVPLDVLHAVGGVLDPTVIGRGKTTEERLDELQRQIKQCTELVSEHERACTERDRAAKAELQSTIDATEKELKERLESSVLGGIPGQVLGVLLVVWAVVLNLLYVLKVL